MMKAWQHFKTITTHKMWVMRYCFKIGLYWQGLTHDLSKYSPTEFLVGMKYYQGDRSPNNAEREDTGMSNPGCTIKGATNIILNTGLITVSIVTPSSKASQCRAVTSPR